MSSCRATSFYLAPGVMRYFRDHTVVAVLPDGTWVELAHRNDVARVRRAHPSWDGSVLCGPPGGVTSLRGVLLDDPAKVERWNLDERVVEGRRPEGPQYVLHRLVWSGVAAVGGARQVVDAVLPGANKPLRAAATALLDAYGPNAALRLSLANALRGVLSDDELAGLLVSATAYELQPWLGVEIARFRENFLHATKHTPESRSRLARDLLTGTCLTDSEIVAALDAAERVTPEIAEWLQSTGRRTLYDIVVDIAAAPGIGDAQHLAILKGDVQNAKQNLGGNAELRAETVEQAWREGADLESLWWRVPMTDAMLDVFLADESTGLSALAVHTRLKDLAANTRLRPDQLDRVVDEALRRSDALRQKSLVQALAENPMVTTEQRVRILEAAGIHAKVVCEVFAGVPHSSDDVLEWIAAHGDDEAKLRMLGRTRPLTEPVLRALCQSTHDDVVAGAAYQLVQRGVPSDEEAELVAGCAKEMWPALAQIAQHPETLLQLVTRAAAEWDETSAATSSRASWAEALGVAPAAMARVPASSDWSPASLVVDISVNGAGVVTGELASALALHADERVARAALEHLGEWVSEAARVKLSGSDTPLRVRHEALRSAACYPELQRVAFASLDMGNSTRTWLVQNAQLSEETQQLIVRRAAERESSGDESFSRLTEFIALAANRHTLTEETLSAFMSERSPTIRRSAAERDDLRGEALEAALTDPDDTVRWRASHLALRREKRAENAARAAAREAAAELEALQPVVGQPDVGALTKGRVELREESDIHRMTEAVRDGAQRVHHPIEYAAQPAAVLAESATAGASELVRTLGAPVRSVRELPDWGAVPFQGMAPAREAIDGFACAVPAAAIEDERYGTTEEPDNEEPDDEERDNEERDDEALGTVAGEPDGEGVTTEMRLVARVLDSKDAITRNAEYMGNCTGGYVTAVARGETRLVGMYDDDGRCQLNIALENQGGTWVPGEINTRFNGYGYGYGRTPQVVQRVADELAARLNAARSTPTGG